jgi:hypothetical protein
MQTAPARSTGAVLSGRWRFDPDQSDDARKKVQEAAAGRHPGGSGWGGGGGGHRGGGYGGGGHGGGYGGGRGGSRAGGMEGGGRGRPSGDSQESMRSYLDAPAELVITETEAEIAILEKDGRLRALHPDGQMYRDDSGSEIKTRWDKDKERLIVETKRERGPKLTETFSLAGEKRQLVVNLLLDSPFLGSVKVKRVYVPETVQ